ncbi:hypothetical protein Patl_3210 [Paraglaciecola sp. T6c]|uniref:sulfotransferase family protein n=1 Tax=Pseudoalteromonas atlantica (strain T6c / ATCC BAA-1087) TaxID=3042615 RepID=UPI00005C6CCD|nr:sulfotransferase family protein [Paraglaciecola sp. T6c]ABG41716.1 hypothetical protein Patl_3210 [Paraglaciecola sp. T6c]
MGKRIFIHIGPPKSGTSAIQYALQRSRAFLSDSGVYYPEHEIGPNGISSGNLTSILSMDNDGKWGVSLDKITQLLASFERSSAHTLLLSSEYFFYLVEDIAEKIPSAKFIAYIRCPLETFESSYNQSVKRHNRTSEAKFNKNLHTTTINILTELINTVGRARFLLRAYLPKNDGGFDLVSDFSSCLDLSLPAPLSVKEITNRSYTLEALEFKRWLNQFKLTELDPSIDQALQAYNDGTKSFTLLPDELSQRYQKQALNKVRDFVQTYKVHNGRRLINYLKVRAMPKCAEQLLGHQQLGQICNYLMDSYPKLYTDICVKISQSSTASINHSERISYVLKRHVKSQSLWLKIKKIFLKSNGHA